MADNLVRLDYSDEPQTERLIQPRSLSEWTTRSFGALKMSTLSAYLSSADRGITEDFADLVEYVITTDPHVASLVETRRDAVAGAAWQVTPGRGPDGTEAIAELAAEVMREELERHDNIERVFGDLLYAVALGWSVMEHDWLREDGLWRSTPHWLQPRDVRFGKDWTVELRTYKPAQARWLRAAEYAAKFIVHIPRTISATPMRAGAIRPLLWQWLFKRWNEKFRNAAMERFGTPKMFGIMPEKATATARANMLDGLTQLSFDHVGVFETGASIEVVESNRDAGASCNAVIDHLNAEMSKAYLGSGLNVEVGSTGGNRALGESQFSTTTLPRLMSDAARLANTIERDWFVPFLAFNDHLFGGVVPPTPQLTFSLIQEQASAPLVGITQMAVNAGVVTKDELRVLAQLEPLGPPVGEELIPALEAPQASAAPFAESAPGRPGRAHVEHEAGGEWRVVTHDGESVSVHPTKGAAVSALEAYESTTPSEVAPLDRPFSTSRPSGPTRSPSRSPLAAQLACGSGTRASSQYAPQPRRR